MGNDLHRAGGPPSWKTLTSSFLEAAGLALVASILALVTNWARSDGLPLIRRAPFDLYTDCPEVREIPKVAVSALPKKAKGVVFVDSRKAWAYCAGHVPGAVFLPIYETEPPDDRVVARLKELRGRWIVVYGDKEVMGAARLATALANRGVRGLHLLEGGLSAWKAAGRPLERCRIQDVEGSKLPRGARLVDARPEEVCRRDQVSGALCFPFDDVLAPDRNVLQRLLTVTQPIVVFDAGQVVSLDDGTKIRPAWAVAAELKARGAALVEVVRKGRSGLLPKRKVEP